MLIASFFRCARWTPSGASDETPARPVGVQIWYGSDGYGSPWRSRWRRRRHPDWRRAARGAQGGGSQATVRCHRGASVAGRDDRRAAPQDAQAHRLWAARYTKAQELAERSRRRQFRWRQFRWRQFRWRQWQSWREPRGRRCGHHYGRRCGRRPRSWHSALWKPCGWRRERQLGCGGRRTNVARPGGSSAGGAAGQAAGGCDGEGGG